MPGLHQRRHNPRQSYRARHAEQPGLGVNGRLIFCHGTHPKIRGHHNEPPPPRIGSPGWLAGRRRSAALPPSQDDRTGGPGGRSSRAPLPLPRLRHARHGPRPHAHTPEDPQAGRTPARNGPRDPAPPAALRRSAVPRVNSPGWGGARPPAGTTTERGPGHRPRQADGRPAAKLSLPSPMRAGPTRATLSIGIATKSSPAHCPCGRARATRHRPPGSAGCDRPRGRPGLLQLMPVRAGADENQGCKSGSMTRPIPRPRKRIEASAVRVF